MILILIWAKGEKQMLPAQVTVFHSNFKHHNTGIAIISMLKFIIQNHWATSKSTDTKYYFLLLKDLRDFGDLWGLSRSK